MHKNLFILALSFFVSTLCYSQTNFKVKSPLRIGDQGTVVAVGDINNDGLEDIVAATGRLYNNDSSYKIFVFLQNVSGKLNDAVSYSYPNVYPGLNAITIDDVNNDRLNDIIIGHGDSIGIFSQNSGGTLNKMVSYYSGESVYGVKTGDLNNDGLKDIAVAHWNETFIRIFYQNDTGFSSTRYSKPSGGYDEIEVKDVTSDGLDDVIYMIGQGAGGVHVFKQNSSGTLNNYVSYYPPGDDKSVRGIAVGDLNNDGANDLAGTVNHASESSRIIIWYQDVSTKKFKSPVELETANYPAAIEIADLDCDGKNEIFVTQGGHAGYAIVYHQNSLGKYKDYDKYFMQFVSHPMPQSLSYGDINNDGRKDIVSIGYNSTVQLAYNITTTAKYDKIDTVILLDTLKTYNVSETRQAAKTTVLDSIPGFYIVRVDKYRITEDINRDSIKVDSVFIKFTTFCKTITDTITNSGIIINNKVFNADSAFISTSIDTVNTLGIKQSAYKEFEIQFYPNPTNGIVNINIKESQHCDDDLTLKVYDNRGLLIQSKLLNKYAINNQVDLSPYLGGLYYFVMSSSNCSAVGKVLKMP